ncbi:alpha-2-macroglobulin family protein [Hymenobacter saemangeumensis]
MTIHSDSATPVPPPDPFAKQWKKVDALLAKNMTASAAPVVEAIYQQARKEQNTPAYVRALLYKVRLLERKEEDADEKAIALLEKDLQKASFPARPIIHSILGELYTNYLNSNRYRIYDRTAGATPSSDSTATADVGTGISTWDIGQLGSAIVRHYYLSVEDQPQKQLKITLAQLGSLVTGGNDEGRALRPSLYDLLAHRAITGLQNQELYITRPEQQFQLTEPKLYGAAAEFAALRLLAPEPDSLNGQLHALHVLQRLTASRLQLAGDNQAALADVDLLRVAYLHGVSQNKDLNKLYLPALERMAQQYAALPIGTEFLVRQIELLRTINPVEAVRLARVAESRFPQSRGGRQARRIREEIELPSVEFRAADIVAPGQPWRFDATIRNVERLHAWAYRITLSEWQHFNSYTDRRNHTFAERYARALKARPAATWSVPMPPAAAKYQPQAVPAAGAALPSGYYLVMLSSKSTNPTQQQRGEVTSYAVLGVSGLSALRQFEPKTGDQRLLLLHRHTGVPQSGVKLQSTFARFDQKTRKETYRKGKVLVTATDGEVLAERPDLVKKEYIKEVRAWSAADTLIITSNDRRYESYEESWRSSQQPSERQRYRTTFLYTDRAIYRPGQTVYFKGILTETEGEKRRLLPQESVSLRLVDVNGQTVQTLTFTTSEFGSFNGSLLLPTGLLNGMMSLQADNGGHSFTVEEYKRPTFAVAFEPVSGRPELGKPITVEGQAKAYAGQAVDGATVSFRVVRQELWYMYGYGRHGGNNALEIAHGQLTTDVQGRFAITFTPPLPEENPSRRWRPGYLFQVTADVVDAAGETQTSTQTIVIGEVPINLQLDGPPEVDKQRPASFRLFSTNATGEPTPVAGSLRILALRYRPEPAGVPAPIEGEAADDKPELVKTLPFDTKAGPDIKLAAALAELPTGRYRLEAQAADTDSAQARHDFVLFDSNASVVPFAAASWTKVLQDSVAPGQPATLLLGSRYAGTQVLLEVESAGKLLRKEWLTLAENEQRKLTIAPNQEDARAPLVIHTTQVLHNQLYRYDATVAMLENPEPLRIDLSTFRDRLAPGQRETWRLTIRQADGKPADAELLATLYDQSLDVFQPHSFGALVFSDWRYYPTLYAWNGSFGRLHSQLLFVDRLSDVAGYVSYPRLINWNEVGYGLSGWGYGHARPQSMSSRSKARISSTAATDEEVGAYSSSDDASFSAPTPAGAAPAAAAAHLKMEDMLGAAKPAAADLSGIVARKDFRETAFWQPALRTDKDGNIVLEFQMPEAVTRWQLFALAHDKQLHTGQLARQLVTQKQLQVTPNMPRFFRQGDQITLTAKVSNLSESQLKGQAQLFLLDAATGQDITSQLLKGDAQQAVTIEGLQSTVPAWNVSLPAGFEPAAITWRVVAQASSETGSKKRKARNQAASYTDGEENTLAVLPNRMLITESLPMTVVGATTREFELKKLSSTSNSTRQNHSLTLEMTPSPAWYAVQSLPYLVEYPYESAENVFSRLYANLIAAHILRSNPRIVDVLKEWQRQAQNGTAAQKNALESKLAQNQELKNLLLQETPWVRDAQSETERLARLLTLFDQPRLEAETARALAKLQQMQQPDGAFPWFEKMPADRYITQLVVAGFGKLRKLGVFNAYDSKDQETQLMLANALSFLDRQLENDYQELRRMKGIKLSNDHLGDLQTQALYAHSFWHDINQKTDKDQGHTYFLEQAAKYWPSRTRYLQAEIALALFRAGKAPAAKEIMRSLSENALHSPELGMYWKEVRGGYYWREAPTETQSTLIEAYHEVDNDQKAVDEMKLWLLKQKQTHSWESTRATADACYALLLRGSDWLAPRQPLKITVGGEKLKAPAAQAGTGYIKTSWAASEVKPAQGRVKVEKADGGVAWGALYWQYFEELDKITPAATPLSLERQLYRETRTAGGPVLEMLTAASPLKVGDALVVRLVLRTDRELEYVHLKDQRAAGLEPIGQTSGYRYQNGLGYYESPRDAATNFFLGAVPRGTHVFEYRLRAAQAGSFSGGLSQVQCLYAPEFGAHSAGMRIGIVR